MTRLSPVDAPEIARVHLASIYLQQATAATSANSSSQGIPTQAWNISDRPFQKVQNKLRYFYVKQGLLRKWDKKYASCTKEEVVRLIDMYKRRSDFAKLTREQQGQVLEYREIVAGLDCSGSQANARGRKGGNSRVTPQDKNVIVGKALLLTMIGEWGVLKMPEGTQDASSDCGHNMDLLVKLVKATDHYQKEWAAASHWIGNLVITYHLDRHVLKSEICVERLKDNVLKVHFHVAVSRKAMSRILVHVPLKDWHGQPTNVTPAYVMGRSANIAVDRQFYYVGAPKSGSIDSAGTYLPFKNFSVNGLWVQSLWLQSKMDDATAIKEHISSGQDAKRYHENIAYVAKWKRTQILKQRQEEEELRITAAMSHLPLKYPAEVSTWWLSHDVMPEQARYAALVFFGNTQCGKTTFLRRWHYFLYGNLKKLLVLDCSNTTTPDMRAYDSTEITTIAFEEPRIEVLVKQKILFQASTARVMLGSSPTNDRVYYVNTFRKRLVICSNTWEADLEKLFWTDYENYKYFTDPRNIVAVRCTENTFKTVW